VNRLNVGDITGMPTLAASLGLDRFSMNMVIPTGSAEKNRDILLRYTEIGKEVLAVQAAANEAGVEFLWYSPTPLCIFNPILHDLGNKGCAACDGLISVSPSGDLLPCSSFNKPLGNLLQEGFRTLWESREAVRFRYKVQAPQACKACDRLAVCNGGCPLYWNVMGYDELVGRMEV
jgi:radical SAM protein with 4Fe4S-binding SPASM domain